MFFIHFSLQCIFIVRIQQISSLLYCVAESIFTGFFPLLQWLCILQTFNPAIESKKSFWFLGEHDEKNRNRKIHIIHITVNVKNSTGNSSRIKREKTFYASTRFRHSISTTMEMNRNGKQIKNAYTNEIINFDSALCNKLSRLYPFLFILNFEFIFDIEVYCEQLWVSVYILALSVIASVHFPLYYSICYHIYSMFQKKKVESRKLQSFSPALFLKFSCIFLLFLCHFQKFFFSLLFIWIYHENVLRIAQMKMIKADTTTRTHWTKALAWFLRTPCILLFACASIRIRSKFIWYIQ